MVCWLHLRDSPGCTLSVFGLITRTIYVYKDIATPGQLCGMEWLVWVCMYGVQYTSAYKYVGVYSD